MNSDMKKTIGIFFGTCIIAFAVIFMAVSLTGKGKSLEKQLQLGQNYLTEAKYEEAVVAFQKVLEIDPKQMSAYAGIAEALEKLDRKEEAVTWLEQALTVVESDYSKTDDRFQDTPRVLSQLLDLYEEKEEAEKAEHVRQILKEKGLEEETQKNESTEKTESAPDVPRLAVARPDLTKMKLEQVICYLYSADNERAKQWQFDKMTDIEAGQIVEACLKQNFMLNSLDELNFDIQYEGDANGDRNKMTKETAQEFLKGIGVAVKNLDFSSASGLQETDGGFVSAESNYGEYQLFAHIVNLVPGSDGSLTVTGNVGWTGWPADADIVSDLDPELVSHFKAVLARTEDPYLDGYVFTSFECGSTDYSAQYNTAYDASGEAGGFADLLQMLYDQEKADNNLDGLEFTVADVNHDGKTELIITLPGEYEEDSYYGIWQWYPRMKEAYMVDRTPYSVAFYDQKDQRGQFNMLVYLTGAAPDYLYYKYSEISGRYLFWDSWHNTSGGFDVNQAYGRDIEVAKDQQLDLKWKPLIQEEIDRLRKEGIWKTEKAAPENGPEEEAENSAQQRTGEMAAFAELLKNACQNPTTYLNSEASVDPMHNQFAISDINQDGKKELLVEYEIETNPGVLTGIWQWDEGSKKLVLKDTLGGTGRYYSNGVVSIDLSHNHTNGEAIWPYELYQHQPQTGKYEDFAYAWCTDMVFGGENGAYKAEEDSDQDGVIYYFRLGDDRGQPLEDAEPHTKAEYDAFVAQYTPEDKAIALDWKDLTIENASRLTNQ